MPPPEPPGAGLLGSLLTTDAMAAATSGPAWVKAMLDFESSLAAAQARLGIIPSEAASEILQCCRHQFFDPDDLGRQSRLAGNPAVALVARLREGLTPGTAPWAHYGATSQDVLDTAAMLILGRAADLVLADLGTLAASCAGLAHRYRSTPVAGRTLLQQAVPMTFGRKAAGWLVAVLDRAQALALARRGRLALQLGGPVGTLDAIGARADELTEVVAAGLGLQVPVLPWHTDRSRVLEVAGAFAAAAASAAKVALDVSLLMQTEVGEATEPAFPGRGGSSSMPHKRNPAMSATVLAAWRTAQAQYGLLGDASVQEHERAAGAWQAEPHAITELCRSAGGAVSLAAEMVGGLEVHPDRMEANLGLTTPGWRQDERTSARLAASEAMVDRALDYYRNLPTTGGGPS